MHSQPGGTPPVFVDRTGRRRRLSILAGTVMGLGLLTSLVLIAAGLFGGSSVSPPGWSENPDQAPIEAGVEQLDAPDGPGSTRTTEAPRPSPPTATTLPAPGGPASTAVSTTAPRPTAPRTDAPQPPASQPGQGEDRRSTAKPSKSPGRSG